MGKEKRVRKVEMRGRENMVKSERFSEDDGDFIMACAHQMSMGIFHHV